jgi:NAD(P)-dependent dehydrogenase (short-subunit alcohol dehydrogenase family)
MLNDLFSVAGRTALVTGGSRGIGEMIAAGFLTNGAKVYISSRKAKVCDETAQRLMDSFAGAEQIAAQLAEREARLDILVNNAGVAWGAPLEAFPESGWDKVFDTNVKGVFFLTQKLLPLLRKAASAESPARVVNIGSIDGIKTPGFDNYSYGPSKAAVHHLTRVLAAKLVREHILVNAIAPGPFPTWMLSTGVGFGGKTDGDGVDWDAVGAANPSGRVGTPEDIAGLTLFLCSRASNFVVGQTIACDGGSVAAS